MRLPGGPDEVDDLVVGHAGHLPPVDDDHLVPLVKAGHALVCRGAHRHPADDHRNTLVGPALHVEPKASLGVGVDGDGDDPTVWCEGVPGDVLVGVLGGVRGGRQDGGQPHRARLAGRFTGSSAWLRGRLAASLTAAVVREAEQGGGLREVRGVWWGVGARGRGGRPAGGNSWGKTGSVGP